MRTKTFGKTVSTNDLVIRTALKKELKVLHSHDNKVRIIEELGVHHGIARVDIAVINGILHGYEIKSDRDTLERLPEQINEYNAVFDRITLVVGKHHLYDSIKIIPNWWGIILAKINGNSSVIFNLIREGDPNKNQKSVSVARLLWKKEALKILEEYGEADGFYFKSRGLIYKKLSTLLDKQTLGEKVRDAMLLRTSWRPDAPLILNDD